MSAYIPVVVWVISGVVCIYIAKRRHVKLSLFWDFVVVLLGPFAVPLMFLAKADTTSKNTHLTH
jgi:hypothetical protein